MSAMPPPRATFAPHHADGVTWPMQVDVHTGVLELGAVVRRRGSARWEDGVIVGFRSATPTRPNPLYEIQTPHGLRLAQRKALEVIAQ